VHDAFLFNSSWVQNRLPRIAASYQIEVYAFLFNSSWVQNGLPRIPASYQIEVYVFFYHLILIFGLD